MAIVSAIEIHRKSQVIAQGSQERQGRSPLIPATDVRVLFVVIASAAAAVMANVPQ